MKYLKLVIVSIVFLLLSGCTKDAEIDAKEYPYVVIDQIDIKNKESVTIHAHLYYSGNSTIIDHGFIFSDNAFQTDFVFSTTKSLGALEKDQNHFSITLKSGLYKDMEFYVRAYTETTENLVYSNEKTFISPIGNNNPFGSN